MPRMTVADVIDLIDFGRIMGICPRKADGTVDPRVYLALNRAQYRMIARGNWIGSTQLARFCISGGCVTMPRQVERVDEAMLNGVPLSVRNPWFEFVDPLTNRCGDGYWYGYGPFTWQGANLIDHGYYATFRDIIPSAKKLRIYPSSPNDVGKDVYIQAFDDSNQNIIEDSNYNGMKLTIALPYVESAYYVSSIVGVIKPETERNINLYEADAAGSLRLLAIYEPTETTPEYHRYQMPVSCSCENQTFLALVKLKHIPVKRETDFLIIENPAAFEEFIRALEKKDANQYEEAARSEMDGVRELNLEKRTRSPGDQISISVRTQGRAQPIYHGVGRM